MAPVMGQRMQNISTEPGPMAYPDGGMDQDRKARGSRTVAAVVALLVVVGAGSFAARVEPGPVFWVDLYWTALIEVGWVDPSSDRYPWTVAVDWSPDGQTLVTAGYHPEVLLWDARTGSLRRRLPGHRAWVQEAVFSPDGTRIASVDWGGHLLVRGVNGRAPRRLRAGRDLFTVAFHPLGGLLATGSMDGTVSVFDLRTGEVQERFTANPGGTLFVTYSPGGRLLAAAGEDRTIHLLDASSYRTLARLTGHRGGVTSVSFDRGGKTLLSCGDDGTLRRWDLASRRLLRTWHSGARWVNFCTMLPDGQRFLSADTSGAVRLWSVGSQQRGRVLLRHDDWAQCVRVSRDGERMASVGKAGKIHIWDLKADRLLRTMDVGQVMRK